MHRYSQGNQNLITLNPEIEATIRKQSCTHRKNKVEATIAGRDNQVLRDYIMPQSPGITSSFVNTMVEENNFELRLALISPVERD